MQTPQDTKHPLPKIRTFAQDLEDMRAKRGDDKTSLDTPAKETVVVSEKKPVQAAPAPKPAAPSATTNTKVAGPTSAKTIPPIPLVSAPKKSGVPATDTPAPSAHKEPVAAHTLEAVTAPAPQIKKLAVPAPTAPIRVVTTTTPAAPEVRDTHYEATVITDNKHKRFRLGNEIIKSVQGWWKEQQKKQAAKRAPKYTIPQADLRKGVIQQATSKTGRGSISDHSAVLARIRENAQSGKAAIASQVQIKHPEHTAVETTPTVIVPIPQPEPILPTPVKAAIITPQITTPSLPQQAALEIPSVPVAPIVPTAPYSIQQNIVTETQESKERFEPTPNPRKVDVYIPYEPAFGYTDVEEPVSYPDEEPQTLPAPTYTPPAPTPLVSTIRPMIAGSYSDAPATNQPAEIRHGNGNHEFLQNARNLLVDEGREIVSWTGAFGKFVLKLRTQLKIKALIQNPNHLVLASLVTCSVLFVGYIVSNTVFNPTSEKLLTSENTDSEILFPSAQMREVSLLAPNKAALFGGISSQLQTGDTISEIVILDSAKSVISTTAFITVFYNTLDQNFIASIKTVRFGAYRGTPWIAITTGDTATAKGGMLAWEKTLSKDLEPLFGAAITTNNKSILGSFTDVSQGDVDTRVLPSATGEEKLVYGLINQDTILITTSSLAFTNLLQSL